MARIGKTFSGIMNLQWATWCLNIRLEGVQQEGMLVGVCAKQPHDTGINDGLHYCRLKPISHASSNEVAFCRGMLLQCKKRHFDFSQIASDQHRQRLWQPSNKETRSEYVTDDRAGS